MLHLLFYITQPQLTNEAELPEVVEVLPSVMTGVDTSLPMGGYNNKD